MIRIMYNNDNEFNNNNQGDQAEYSEGDYSFPEMEYRHYSHYEEPKKKGGGVKIVALALACALVGSIGGGAIVGGIMSGNSSTPEVSQSQASLYEDAAIEPDTETIAPLSTPRDNYSGAILVNTNSNDVTLNPSQIYEQYANAVVGISNETTYTNAFGQTSSTASSGSGFIISSDGYVITNAHVVADAESIKVIMLDETSYEAEIVGSDTENDVALLKIDATGLPAVSIGDTNNLKVGEQVVAIGNPLGELTHTLTVGYVSSLDREINTDGTPINMLQTDAAINPGNSGGPLFDSHGNVIGITTAKYSSSTLEGLGFAIPVSDAMSIIYDLQEYGYVKGRASFGISVQSLNLTYASYYGLPVGILIMEVNEGSCAEIAGLEVGDVITELNGVTVQSYTDLTSERKKYSAGDTVDIKVYRKGEYLTYTITFDEQQPKTIEAEPVETQQPSQDSGAYNVNPFGGYYYGNGDSSTDDAADAA